MDNLNSKELTAAILNAEGGVYLVQADAGAGKTELLNRRLKARLKNGRSDGILCVTFTTKAAEEMKRRAGLPLDTPSHSPFVGTVHSFCMMFLRENSDIFRTCRMMTSLDEYEIRAALRFDTFEEETGVPFSMVQRCALSIRQKEHGHAGDALVGCHLPGQYGDDIEHFARKYLKFKDQRKLKDFDDLLTDTYDILKGQDKSKLKHASFGWIQVDEVQDLNPLQLSVVEELHDPDGTLMYFGDDKQSIFSFMGARSETINELRRRSRVFTLSGNRRSSDNLINVFNAFAAKELGQTGIKYPQKPEQPYPELVLHTEGTSKYEHANIARRVIQIKETRPGESIGVLVRTGNLADSLSLAFNESYIEYVKVSGADHLKRDAIKVLLAHFRVSLDDLDYFNWAIVLQHVGCTTSLSDAVTLVRTLQKSAMTPSDFLLFRGAKSTYLMEFIHAVNGEVVSVDMARSVVATVTVNGAGQEQLTVPDDPAQLMRLLDFAGGRPLVCYDANGLSDRLKTAKRCAGIKSPLPQIWDLRKIIRLLKQEYAYTSLGYFVKTVVKDTSDDCDTVKAVRWCMENATDKVQAQEKMLKRLGIRYVDAKLNGDYRHHYLAAQNLLNSAGHYNAADRLVELMKNTHSDFLKNGISSDYNLALHRYRGREIDRQIQGIRATSQKTWNNQKDNDEALTRELTEKFFNYVRNWILRDSHRLSVREILDRYLPSIESVSEADVMMWDGSQTGTVSIITIHKAKGQGFDHVIISDASSKSFDRTDDKEDARLFYVAMTRARKTLSIYAVQNKKEKQFQTKLINRIRPFFTVDTNNDE